MKDDTTVTTAGRSPENNYGIVNPPVYHASTILYPTLERMEAKKGRQEVQYGRRGTPTTFALEDAVSAIEGAEGTILTSSGLAAVSLAMMTFTKAGDHILITDSVYGPARRFADEHLKRYGVEVDYYNPLIGSDIASLCKDNTSLIWLESPGSQTFEVQDIPAIAAVAREKGITTVIDNTWAAGIYLKPLALGVDVSIHAGTKYFVGHSDAMLGTLSASGEFLKRIYDEYSIVGHSLGPDDAYLAMRGIRTLTTRLRQHMTNALKIAQWLEGRPEVLRVMHPALESDPGHELWKRDFTGACGLFGFVMEPCSKKALAAMLDDMKLFGMGYSWGGYESLLIPTEPAHIRTATTWSPGGQTMRIHVGLEDTDDLIEDLEAGFARLKKAS